MNIYELKTRREVEKEYESTIPQTVMEIKDRAMAELEAEIAIIKIAAESQIIDIVKEKTDELARKIAGIKLLKGDPGKNATIDYEKIITTVLKRLPPPSPTPEVVVDYGYILKEVKRLVPPPEKVNMPTVDYEYIVSMVLSRIPPVAPNLPQSGMEIVRSINDLEIKPELQIDWKHIKNTPKEKKERKAKKGGGGNVVLAYDLSAYLDGATKTFTLPAYRRIVSIVASSFPTAFRPTVDYTTTRTSITFTSEINAASTLASGQTVIITYVE